MNDHGCLCIPAEGRYGDSLRGLAGRQTWWLDGSSIRYWEEHVPTWAGEGYHSIRCWECDMDYLHPLLGGIHPIEYASPSAIGRVHHQVIYAFVIMYVLHVADAWFCLLCKKLSSFFWCISFMMNRYIFILNYWYLFIFHEYWRLFLWFF